MPQCRSLDEVVAIHSFLPLSQSTRNLYPLVVLRLSEAPVFRLTRLTSVIHSISSTIWTYCIHISLLILLMSKPVSLSEVHIIDVFFLSLTARKPINPEHDTNEHTIHTYTSYVAYVIVSLSLTRLACSSMIHASLTICMCHNVIYKSRISAFHLMRCNVLFIPHFTYVAIKLDAL